MVAYPHEGRLLKDEKTGQLWAWILVQAEDVGVPGLALTNSRCLTHLPSGARIATFRDRESAMRAAVAIGELGDWTKDSPNDEPGIQASAEAVLKALGGTRGQHAELPS